MAEMNKYTAERILELQGEHNAKALNKAYRKLAMECHPDTAPKGQRKAAEARMADINAAKDYLDSIFRTTGRITLVCDSSSKATAASAAEAKAQRDQAYADAVKAAQEAANRRETREREAAAYAAAAAQAAYAESVDYEPVASKPENATSTVYGWDGKPREKKSGLVEVLRKIFSFDIAFRILFLVIAVSMTGYATTDAAYLFWAAIAIVSLVNMIFPLVTTPIRKLVLAVLNLMSPKSRF